ncbi:MAG: FecR family protein [Candidatus Delongbacteria bacterium]
MNQLTSLLILLAVLGSARWPLHAQEFDRTRAAAAPTPVTAQDSSMSAPEDAGLGLVSYREGLLARFPERAADWLDAPLRSHVAEGDRVRTGPRGRAEIEFQSRNLLRLAPSTTLRLDRLAQEEQDAALRVDLQLEQGELWAELNGLDEEDEFSVGSRVMGAAITGTGLRVAVNERQETVLSVLHGEVRVAADRESLRGQRPTLTVDSLRSLLKAPKPRGLTRAPTPVGGPVPVPGPHEVSLREWLVIVKTNQEIRIGSDGRVQAAGALQAKENSDWIRWNQERNAGAPTR